MDAETIKAWSPILIALFAMITSIVTVYFTYRTNKTAKRAEAKADAAHNVAVEAVKLRAGN